MSKLTKISIIGGCGHVGLPLGISFALGEQYHVDLIDTSERSVQMVNTGRLHFEERGGEQALEKVLGKSLFAHTSPDTVAEADVVVFVTGTPVDEHLNPRVDDIMNVINAYIPLMNSNQLVVLRSTVYPGVTDLVRQHFDDKIPNIDVTFCPERVAQGYGIEEIRDFPQIVSGFTPQGEQRAAELFEKIVPEVIRLTPIEAELAKLFSNTWRYLEFATANQHYMIAEAAGADFNRVYKALTYKYPRAATFKRPGLTAGPCLFKDTMQLSAFYKNNFFLGHAAMLINEGLPNFVVDQLEKKLGTLKKKKIGLLGMAFKPNNDDTRESLSYKVKKVLQSRQAIVLETDVFQQSSVELPKVLKDAEAFVLGVPHDQYLNIDTQGKPFVDCWGAWSQSPDLSVSPHPQELRSKLKVA